VPIAGIAALLLVAALLAVALALRSGSAGRVQASTRVAPIRLPAGWTATPRSLRALLSTALGPASVVPRYASSDGLPRVRSARCTAGSCAVSYNTDYTPSFHTIAQMTAQQGPLVGAILADRSVGRVALTAWGPSRAEGRVGQNPLFTLDCTRAEVAGLDLTRVSPIRLRSACAYVPYVSGIAG
jgi:hypothetical protein